MPSHLLRTRTLLLLALCLLSFEASIERAEKWPADRRDGVLTMAVLHQSDLAPLETVEAAAQKIEEVEIRRQVLGWVYFRRGQNAVYAGDFDAARRFAERVEALEARALLLLNIASQGLKRSDDKQRAEELLTAVLDAARKSPDSVSKARSLLGVAHLYARFDYLRGLSAMGEAVAAVNKLNDPDLGSASLPMHVQGKNFSTFAGWPMPTFTLESSFGELGARDFEATLARQPAQRQVPARDGRPRARRAVSRRCGEAAAAEEARARRQEAVRTKNRVTLIKRSAFVLTPFACGSYTSRHRETKAVEPTTLRSARG